ncbi:titin-like isoform X5 [Symsagittifera roscoffensis]|uniref:titin-like isoform X5 n=1 Tax=Symsagittifera roscoffensis TaxID=84072 RepID=UPI00307C37F1
MEVRTPLIGPGIPFSKQPSIKFSPDVEFVSDFGTDENSGQVKPKSESQSAEDVLNQSSNLNRSDSTEKMMGSLSVDLSGSVLVLDDTMGSAQSLTPTPTLLRCDSTPTQHRASEVESMLRQNLANLIGAEDYSGCAIVTIPNRVTKQELSTNQNSLLETLMYFSSISKPEGKSKGFTVIVDTRGTFGKAVKPFARFFAALPDWFMTKQLVFVKADDFLEKKIANLRIKTKKNREMPVQTVSAKKLDKIADKNQLPSELGGSVNYNHRMWINNRIDFESFVQSADNILAVSSPDDNRVQDLNKAAVADCCEKGEELVKRLVNLPDPKSLHTYQPESTDQRDMRLTVESYLTRLAPFRPEKPAPDPGKSGSVVNVGTESERDAAPGSKMSEKRELLEQLIQDVMKFIDWSRNEGGRLFAGVVDDIGKNEQETQSLHTRNEALIKSIQKYFEWYEKMTSQCEQLKREGYRGEKVDQLASDLSNAYSQTLGRAKNREKLLHTTLQFHKQKKTVQSALQKLENACKEDVDDKMSKQDSEQLLAKGDPLNSNLESSFMQLENLGDTILALLGNLKEQSPETATSRNMIKDYLMAAADQRENVTSSHELWKTRITQYLDLLGLEDSVRSIIDEIAENFGYLAQTLQDDIANATSNFRSSFAIKEPKARDLYNEGMEQVLRISVIRSDLKLSQEPVEDLKEDLAATWKNFFVQFAENGSEDHVVEICWLLMVQNWKLVEKLFKELKDVSSRGDEEQIRTTLNRNYEFKSSVEISYEQTEILTSTFVERMMMKQTNGSVFSNEEVLKLRSQLDSLTEMKNFIDQSYSSFVSHKEAYSFFQVMIEACDWVRIRITEMVPAMLEIGHTLIEALDLYEVHQQFMEKIENRREEIREVLRKADTMVESTDESQSQVYQAMAISLKDAWKELMMRMEERRILLELVITFYRSCEEYNQHLDYAFSVCQSTLIADNIEQVQVLIEEHQNMKKATAEHSMNSIQSGQGLLDKIVEIGRNLENHGPSAVSTSAGVEKTLADLHDRRSLLEEFWLQRKIRLEQSLLIFQLDSEIQQITNWFLTVGSDNMHHVDLGNNPTETEKLIQIHLEFSNEAKIIEARITRVLRSVDTLILTGHEDGDNIRERVSEIESLNRDILTKIESRRKRLMLTIDFWNCASIAFDRLVEIEEQIEETISVPDGTSLGSSWKPERLSKLAQAILESTTPAIREGHIILDASTVGADGVRFIVEKLKERCSHLSSICSEIRKDRSSLFVMYDEKFSVVTTWLVNIGLDLLNRRKVLGTTRHAASDFLDDHSRLRDDLKTRYVDVEACGSTVDSMEINQESGAVEARGKVEELKQRWRTLAMFTEQRISLAETFLQFLSQSTEMVNLMDTLEELLKLDNWNLDARTLESTRRIWLDKFRQMNEVYESVYFKGRCFLKDANTQTLKDNQLSVEGSVELVQKQLELFEERRRIINDLWDTWKLRMPFTDDIHSQWDMFKQDANKSLSWMVEIQKRLFAPLVIGDPKHCRQTAYVMKDRLAEIKITYKRVTSEVERWLKMSEMLNIKQKPESARKKSSGSPVDGEVDETVARIPQLLISEHKSYQTKMELYDLHLTTLVEFLLKLGDLYDAIDATYSEVEKAKCSVDDEEIVGKVLEVLHSTREKEEKLYDGTVKSGHQFMDQVNDKQLAQPAKKETKAILADLELDHQHWLQWCDQISEELQSRASNATLANRAIYILQCIDQFRNELGDMEGVYGDGTDTLLQIIKNFELWLQDLNNFERKDIEPFLESMHASSSPGDNSSGQRCELKWDELQKLIKKHKSLLELAREYHILLDEIESISVECRENVIQISKKTPGASTLDKVNKLSRDLDNCESRVDKHFVVKLDRVYELAKILFNPPPKYLDNLITRKNELQDSLLTVRSELRIKLEHYTFKEEIEKVVQQGVVQSAADGGLMSSLPTVPPKTPPRIISGLEDVTLPKGKSAVFKCLVIGSAPIRVSWQKDGKRLIDSPANRISSNGNQHKLEMPKSALDDTGTITVVAENDFGKTNSSAYLHVQGPQGVPPTIYKVPELLPTAEEGSKIRIDAVISGTPPPEVVWYRNGREITPDNKFKIRSTPEDGSYQLVINDCVRGDAGDYSVCATNDLGEVTKTCKVTVAGNAKPPKFLTPLADAEVEDGKPFRWEVEVEGKPTPVVKWFRGKKDMAKFDCDIQHVGEMCALVLDEIFPDDEGKYTVVATNEHGTAQSEAVLSVTDNWRYRKIAVVGEPPKFVKKPQDKEVQEGKSVEFNCKVTGTPMPEVKWVNKEGEEITEGEDFKLSFKNGTATLLIKEVIPEDDGRVICKATNKMGESTCSFSIKVLRKTKPFFEVPIKDVSCKELDSCSFNCTVSGDPKPTVQWLHNGEKIEPDKDTKITTSGNKHTLQLKETQYADRGTYKAVASNSEGEQGCSAHLDVEELPLHLKPHAPKIEKHMETQLYAQEGDQVTIECEVTAKPVGEVAWYKDRKTRLKPGPDLKLINNGNTYTLQIKSCITQDSGLYTLFVKNKFGEVSVTGTLYVKEKQAEPEAPEFVVGLHEVVAKEGESVTFECVVKGVPTPTVSWFLNGEKLTEAPDQQIRRNDDKHLLKLHKLEIDDTGPLTATATNSAGTVSSTAPLLVHAREKKPVLIQPLNSVKARVGDPEAVLECKIGNASSGCNLRLLKDDKEVSPDEKHIQLIDDGQDTLRVRISPSGGMKEGDGGQYCVEASNGAGTVTTSAFCHIQVGNNKIGSSSKTTVIQSEEVVTHMSSVRLESDNREAPAFISELLQPPVVRVGQDVTLEIIVKGFPDPKVRWMKDDQPVDPKRCIVLRDEGKCSLQLKQVTPKDEGEYSIVAENGAGRAQCTCQLLIDDSSNAPIFTERLATQEVELGKPLELHVSIRAYPEPKVTWLLNDEPFKPRVGDSVYQEGPRYRCSIKSVTPEHGGKIAVVAENERGKATSSAEIIIAEESEAPTFEKKLEGHVIKQNEPLHFHCVISGSPSPQVVWSLNGVVVQIDGHRITERRIGVNYYLVINDVGPQDAGIYSCTAENSVGKAVSTAEVFVDVGDDSDIREPSFLKHLNPISLSEGAQLMLLCKLDPESAPLDIFWFKDHTQVNPDDRVVIEVSEDWWVRLLIDEVEPSDGGLYSCVAESDSGKATTEAEVEVIARKRSIPPPKIIQSFSSGTESSVRGSEGNPLESRVGEELRLKVILDDSDYSDLSEVRWFKGNQLITQDHRTKIYREDREYSLVIVNVEERDGGEYCAVATNPSTGHSTTSSCFVLVQVHPSSNETSRYIMGSGNVHAPQFASSLENVTVYVDDRVELICHVSGYPLPSVFWTKDSQPLKVNPPRLYADGGEYTYRLVISRVCLEDEGLYVCHAQNEGGHAESSCYMNVLPYEAIYTSPLLVPSSYQSTSSSNVAARSPALSMTSLNANSLPRNKTNSSGPPKFVKQLNDLRVDENQEMKLVVELENPCEVSWLKDNRPLDPKRDGVKIETGKGNRYLLTLPKASVTDSGIYSLRAQSKTNKKQFSTTNCNVVVRAHREAPLIRKKLSGKTVKSGQPLKLEVEVTGVPLPKVTWYKQEKNKNKKERIVASKEFQINQRDQWFSLYLPETFPEDEGTYSIVAENVAGRDSDSAVVKVILAQLEEEAPIVLNLKTALNSQPQKLSKMSIQILKYLEAVTVHEGNPAALQCELSGGGNDQLVVSWSKDGVCVDKDPNFGFSFSNNVARCFISECFPEDSGIWTCTFNHPSGRPEDAVSTSTNLTCREAVVIETEPRSHEGASPDATAPEFVRKLTPQRLVEGGHAMFLCVVSGYPFPDIQWLKNGQPIQSGYRYQVQNEMHSGHCSLSISFILPDEDSGVYTCVAVNVKGQASTDAPLLDDESFKKFVSEDQKRQFVGELSSKVRARSPAVFKQSIKGDQKKDVYIPKYEQNLAKNVNMRMGGPGGGGGGHHLGDHPPQPRGGGHHLGDHPPQPSLLSPSSAVPDHEMSGTLGTHKPRDRFIITFDTWSHKNEMPNGAPKPPGYDFNPKAFEERLMNEIEFRDDKLRAVNAGGAPQPGDNTWTTMKSQKRR